ncbi:hypothetical protein BDZ90DRAFT_241354 [Jaminaea rosea]|uniref:Uncharacterized protein n=1 Tax=Jaminaea rosea TaxID=1569628 RepID=A0A316UPX4_9BASI|nr:hypothetical protein BDZ90DRAFT_241354 [Jaminaea rosea]PWN26838.1 hypothetical protein BDZ90DRAFT_241354 [Jaminaea rosea]
MRRSVILAAIQGNAGGDADASSSSSSTPKGMIPRSAPSSSSLAARNATGGGFGALLNSKPFKTPFAKPAVRGDEGGRKRKRISYKGMGGEGGSDGESDDGEGALNGREAAYKKSKKGKDLEGMYKGIDAQGVSLNVDNRKWAVFKPKVGMLKNRFSLPTIKTKDGKVVETSLSHAALGTRRAIEIPPRPLYDPMGEHAIVLFDPTVDDSEAEKEKIRLQQEQAAREDEAKSQASGGMHKSLASILGLDKKKAKIVEKVPVVIDPRLGKVLRPHQIEGVKFLYRCTTGLVDEKAAGCIMADEMGLGKTLQCIALMWTLLKQSPLPGKPTIDKCIIVCPSSLVRNWANELVKWLGSAAPGTLALDGKLSKDEMITAVHRWSAAKGRANGQPVMIVSYETLRNLTEVLGQTEVGLLLADEGHRLKNADSLTFTALNMIKVKRRVILSGTPIQNDLSEYFALLSFAIPDLLGGKAEFRKNYEIAILKGRDALASDKEKEVGNAKLKELAGLVQKFIIRRTNDLLSKYLPHKYEHVVFCKMAPFQLDLYRLFIRSPEIKKLLRGTGSQPLKAINILKKLCNHPDLLNLDEDLPGSRDLWPAEYNPRDRRVVHTEYSGKMMVLERFLHTIRATSKDKIVLISNYTQTLDVFERMCRNNRWGNFRLDGTMAITKRQKLVDRFNDPESPEFIFLLSSKAGGCGINLIGANRLVLFDPDWNPAADQQALARVWRDGQKKSCFVYRFIGTGGIEEKIFQRQSHKQALSASVVDCAEDAERHFSAGDLKELFEFKDNTDSNTHDTYKCKRCVDGRQKIKAPALLYNDASTWNHLRPSEFGQLHDDLLRAEQAFDQVSFVMQYCSH